MNSTRVDILDVPVDCVDMRRALEFVDWMIRSKERGAVIAVNPEKVIKAREVPLLRQALQHARLLLPDGIGVVVAARILGLCQLDRVPGSELMPRICELAAQKGYRIFLFGASKNVNQKVSRSLAERYPGLEIVGAQDGYVEEQDMPRLIKSINQSGAQILFVALGSPRQEYWMEKHLPDLDVNVCQGVGGTFDVIAGHVRRAPYIFRRMHLEWFYRLLSDPRRMRRQAVLPKFAFHVLRKRLMG